MPFEKFEFQRKWTNKDDFPTFEPSEEQVRKDLQEQPDELKKAIHDLIDELEAAGAGGKIGCSWKDGGAQRTGSVDAALADIYGVKLPGLQNQITEKVFGDAADSFRSAEVSFAAEEWNVGEGSYTYTVLRETHKRAGPAFGYQIWAATDGGYRSNTWYGEGTDVAYQANGDILLTAEEPYAGRIVFFGV